MKKCGDEVFEGEVICELYAEHEHKLSKAESRIEGAIKVTKEKPKLKNLIIDILD